jgi:hypothetical protein
MIPLMTMAMPPNDPDVKVLREFMGLFGKLGPVAFKLNFRKSSAVAGAVMEDAPDYYHMISTVTYKGP